MNFQPGNFYTTPGALEALVLNRQLPSDFLKRHLAHDWGDVCDEDKEANEQALVDGARLLSAYTLNDGTQIWIITEADRSATTILLPSEY